MTELEVYIVEYEIISSFFVHCFRANRLKIDIGFVVVLAVGLGFCTQDTFETRMTEGTYTLLWRLDRNAQENTLDDTLLYVLGLVSMGFLY